MRRIFIPLFSLASLLFVTAASAQNNNPTTQCLAVASAQCNDPIEDFETDPAAKGYTFPNLTWTTAGNNRLASITATGGSTFTVTTPSFFIQTFGSLTAGFTIESGSGGNDVFVGGALPLTLNILNSSNVVVATCSYPSTLVDDGAYCFTIGDADLLSGGMYKYQFVFSVPAGVTGNRIFGFDNVAVGAGQQAVLPVKFANFSAKSVTAGVQLNWTIDAEENTKGYDIERSADGRNFAPIAPVNANGARSYTFVDTKPLSDGYYRIKAIDFDGKFGFSNIIHMRGGESSVVIKGFFSSSNLLMVQHDEAPVGTKISVTSADGRLLKSVAVVKGSQQTSIDVSGARTGLMLVRYETSTGVAETIKIVKQ